MKERKKIEIPETHKLDKIMGESCRYKFFFLYLFISFTIKVPSIWTSPNNTTTSTGNKHTTSDERHTLMFILEDF